MAPTLSKNTTHDATSCCQFRYRTCAWIRGWNSDCSCNLSPSEVIAVSGTQVKFYGRTYNFTEDGVYLDGQKLVPFNSPVQRKVRREEIEEVITRHSIAKIGFWKQPFVNDLLALLNEPGSKTWCGHFRWGKNKECHYEGWLYVGMGYCFQGTGHWVTCPICGAPRPKEEKA